MILEMTIGAIDQSPAYQLQGWAYLLSESAVAAMSPTVISGTGSFATISRTGSNSDVTSSGSNATITVTGGV